MSEFGFTPINKTPTPTPTTKLQAPGFTPITNDKDPVPSSQNTDTGFGFSALTPDEQKTKLAAEPDPRSGAIKSWSFSALLNFEKCAYMAFLKSVKRIPQADNQFSARGTAIHTLAEDFVQGKIGELPQELAKFESDFDSLRDDYNNGIVSIEGEWAYTADWEPTDWFSRDAWNRTKLDAMVHNPAATEARVIDHKTGKKYGNELKHGQQLQMYAIASFMRFPELEFIQTELWYLDHGLSTVKNYTREEAMIFLPRWTTRATKMTTAEEFIPNPSKGNCKWCPYRENNACEWAVS